MSKVGDLTSVPSLDFCNTLQQILGQVHSGRKIVRCKLLKVWGGRKARDKASFQKGGSRHDNLSKDHVALQQPPDPALGGILGLLGPRGKGGPMTPNPKSETRNPKPGSPNILGSVMRTL